ncbi:hypothetical protein EVG20_g1874 [Dentipellis fragilis]|uniref:Spc7 kinetochore protein domain-containing protein n=1 Tax=Dentipellis fragilis TaxID=205917 RepID=A0A4Y9Z9J1_9AGAM|nr:hypothetical protein EVG20_g1874 [Dentipellis fragilis]
MAPSPISRRKSIAVPHHSTAFRPTHKRRPHSITPGDSVLKQLSPAAKRRRSLAPRKSILKAAITPDDTIAPEDATQSMDFTRTFGDMQDNTTRKSLGRRVSFAPAAYVRLFDKDKKGKRRSSAYSDGSPEFSGGKDENASNKTHRRSSTRRSIAFSENGEASMEIDSDFDDTGPLPEGFLLDRSDLQDEEFDDDLGDLPDEDGNDMELTEAMPVRRKSVSFGPRRRSSTQPRAPLAQVSHDPPEESESMRIDDSVSTDDHTQSTDMTQSSNASSGEHSQTMDFTVPVHRPFRKSEPPSEQWLALRAMTHSGDTPYEEPPSEEEDDGDLGLYPADGDSVSMAASEDMELTVAQSRLIALRDSLGLGQATEEDSFTSSENASLEFSNDAMGDQTVNVTNILRQSLGGADTSAMDFTEIHRQPEHTSEEVSEDLIPPPQLSPEQAEAEPIVPTPVPQPSSSVFSAPTPQAPQHNARQALPAGRVFFRPGSEATAAKPDLPSSSTNANPSPRKAGTAAFAPPTTRPQPKRPAAPDSEEQEDRRSPTQRTSVAARASLAAAGRLSPRKGSVEPAPARHANGGLLRRPSGYFAQRKSLGPSGFSNTAAEPQAGPSKTNVTAGRASIGSVAELSGVFERPMSPIAAQRQLREASPVHASASPRQDEVATRFEDLQIRSRAEVHEDTEVERDGQEGDAGPTEQWRAGVQQQSFSDDDGPPISIEQFFAMTGVRFMDEIAAPRRSTIHPSQLQSLRRSSVPEADIPLADYMIAMTVDVPQLEQYSRVVKDLQSWIQNSEEIYRQAEEEATKFTPTLFREYSMADEEVQEELLHQLKLIKANNHGNARSQWYDWRLQWVEGLYEIADKGFSDLEEDARSLESTITQAQSILPSLREEYEQVMRELGEELRIADEIEHCDQDYLNELNSTIAEQEATLEAYRADISETNAQLERLHEKLEEIEAQKRETSTVIDESKRLIHVQKTSTHAEVFRLKDELAALEELHLWRVTETQPDLFELVYASSYRVTVPCKDFRPILDKVEIARMREMPKDQHPRLTDVSLKLAQQRLAASPPDSLSITDVVEKLGDFWIACAQLRMQFKLLGIRYPRRARDHHRARRGKAFISFVWDSNTLARWPMSIRDLTFDVKVAYGAADVAAIREALARRLAQATPVDNHACILDACAEATCDYDEPVPVPVPDA